MGTINFKYIPFTKNLIRTVLDETPPDNTVFVFPSEKSMRVALREFQKKWNFSFTRFTTMEEFKERLFRSANPLLKEEKRTLAFYQSLNQRDKEFFNIHSYFQSIDFAQNFFALWEEFNEELAEENIDLSQLENVESGIHDWQLDTLQRLQAIRSRYSQFISHKNFDDVIFSYRINNINLSAFNGFQNFVFVNQFYYTGLEKKIISILHKNNGSVKIYYQLPNYLVDENSLDVKYFTFGNLGHSRLQKVDVIETQNDFSTLAHLFTFLQKQNDAEIISASTFSAFDNFLNARTFQTNESGFIRNTFLYGFFNTIHELLDNSVFDPVRKKWLLSLGQVMHAFLNTDFYSTINSEIPREPVLEEISTLLDLEFKYVDSDFELFTYVRAPKLQLIIKELFAILNKFRQIKTIPDMLDLIDADKNIRIKSLLSKEQQDCSNIEEIFYQALYDFKTLDDINIVDNWETLFAGENNSAKPVLAIGLLKLFLDYLKPKRFRWNYDLGSAARTSFGNLLDSRNLQYDKIVVLNVIENQLPHASQTPFLFTDNQRKLLGLKTYEDIKLREKYYFFRLLLTSQTATIFTQKNVETNTETSSFLEEIKLYRSTDNLSYKTVGDLQYKMLYEKLLKPDSEFTVKSDTKSADFYRIPLNKKIDFPNNRLNAGFYSLLSLLQNPFSFYMKFIAGLNEKIKEAKEEFSKPLVGNIVHDVLNNMWNLFEEQSAAPMFGYNFGDINRRLIDQSLKFVLDKAGKLYFQIPHNYSFVYFQHIIAPLIVDRILFFFDFLKNSDLQGHNLKVIPEKEYVGSEERRHKCLVPADENNLQLNVNIRGRADLRIENSDTHDHVIVDYKTGHMDREQLVFYELFYYLLDATVAPEKITSYFYHIFDKEIKSIADLYRKGASKESMIEQYKSAVVDAVNLLAEKGFAMPEKRTFMNKLEDISRKDLYLTNYKNFDATELY